MRLAGSTGPTPAAQTPGVAAHLEESDDHDVPAVYQGLGALLVLQPGGTGPQPPPQPLGDAVGLSGACEASTQPGPSPAQPSPPPNPPPPPCLPPVPVYSSGCVRFPSRKNLSVGYSVTANSWVSSVSAVPSTLASLALADSAASTAAALLYSGARALQCPHHGASGGEDHEVPGLRGPSLSSSPPAQPEPGDLGVSHVWQEHSCPHTSLLRGPSEPPHQSRAPQGPRPGAPWPAPCRQRVGGKSSSCCSLRPAQGRLLVDACDQGMAHVEKFVNIYQKASKAWMLSGPGRESAAGP